MKLEINMPAIVEFDDYHDIEHFEEQVRTINSELRVGEITLEVKDVMDEYGEDMCNYFGLIYCHGQKPNKTKRKLIILDRYPIKNR